MNRPFQLSTPLMPHNETRSKVVKFTLCINHRVLSTRVSSYLHWVKAKPRITLSPVQTEATLLANNSQHCWMLLVASVCTPCCMLLDVVACCCAKFKTGQTFQPTTPNISFVLWSPKRSATMLDPFAQLFQHWWGRACSLSMDYKDLGIVFFPRRVWILESNGWTCKWKHK